MIARILVAVGVTAAAVGFAFLGISTSTYEVHQDARDLSYLLMAGGVVAAVVGGFWYRSSEGH
ncbi:MAG: hypothetical protein KF883_10255 [Thermomicrobiales bacterium]|jgi:hypothetical protein|nr:hypothetical protein [Thermomicrobiales bacterium]